MTESASRPSALKRRPQTSVFRLLLDHRAEFFSAFLFHRPFGLDQVAVAVTKAQLPRCQLLTSVTKSFPDIFPVKIERATIVPLSTHDDLRMDMFGVAMNHGFPFEPSSLILFNFAHQIADMTNHIHLPTIGR